MQFCPDKEPKCPENDQLLDVISKTVFNNVTYMYVHVYMCTCINAHAVIQNTTCTCI